MNRIVETVRSFEEEFVFYMHAGSVVSGVTHLFEYTGT